MRNLIRIAAGAALVMGIIAIATPAEAACGLPRAISSLPSTIHTPGGPFNPPYNTSVNNLRGEFWSLASVPAGGGNPAQGPGNDSGANTGHAVVGEAYNWIYVGGYGQDAFLGGGQSHWAYAGTDGCIAFDGAVGTGTGGADDPGQCMVVLLTDDDGQGHGFFALLAVAPDAGFDYRFNTAAGNGPITLAPIPKPNITGSVRNGGNSVDLSVNVPAPAAGLYLGCSPAQNAALAGARYRVYSRNTPPNAGNDPDRDKDTWTPAGGPFPVGQPTTINAACGGVDRDFYLCATIEVPAGNGEFFQMDTCSNDSTRIECGPNLAQPRDPRRTPSQKDDRTQPLPRGGRR
jgi:hypothetical protein